MSRKLEISDELYSRLEAEAKQRGLDSVEGLLESNLPNSDKEVQREEWFRQITEFREYLFKKYGMMPDSTDLIREDRER